MEKQRKIGSILKTIRNDRNLSQLGAARTIGIARSTLSRIEKNIYTPRMNTLQKICDFYRISSKELF